MVVRVFVIFRRALKSPLVCWSVQLGGGVSGQSTPFLLVSGTFDCSSVSSSIFLAFSLRVSCLLIMVWVFLRPRFVFLALSFCHSWHWELCVRRSNDRGSTGSPLGGVPQQVSGLILPCLCLCIKCADFWRVVLRLLKLLWPLGVWIEKCSRVLHCPGFVSRGVSRTKLKTVSLLYLQPLSSPTCVGLWFVFWFLSCGGWHVCRWGP